MTINEKSISDFLKQSIEELKTIIPSEQHKWTRVVIERKENRSQLNWPKIKRPDFEEIIFLGLLGLTDKKLKSIDDFSKILAKDSRYKRIFQFGSPMNPLYFLQSDRVMISILTDYVNQLDHLEYNDRMAKKVAKYFINSLEKGGAGYVFYSVVRGLECDFENCKLTENIILRKMTDKEISRLIERVPELLEEDRLVSNRWILEQHVRSPISVQPSDIYSSSNAFDTVITALRLLKNGRIERQNTFGRKEHPGQIKIGNPSIGKKHKRYPIAQSYELLETDIPNLKKILKFLKGAKARKMRIALDRLNFAAERERHDDKLLDLIISLETIFGDSSGAIGYKIGLRCSVFISDNYNDRKNIKNLVNQAYKRRNALDSVVTRY